jgi:hypothetical protein
VFDGKKSSAKEKKEKGGFISMKLEDTLSAFRANETTGRDCLCSDCNYPNIARSVTELARRHQVFDDVVIIEYDVLFDRLSASGHAAYKRLSHLSNGTILGWQTTPHMFRHARFSLSLLRSIILRNNKMYTRITRYSLQQQKY